MTHHTIADDNDDLSPDETAWNIARARGDIAATLGKALAHLEDATARVERIRALGDTEYTTGLDGLDAQHWITDARRAAQAAHDHSNHRRCRNHRPPVTPPWDNHAMTSKAAQEYLDAVARVPQMDDDDLGTWYAKAVQQYTSLSLWSRLDHQGDTHDAAWQMRSEWYSAATDLFVAIENRIRNEFFGPSGEPWVPPENKPPNRLSGVGVRGEVYRTLPK